jgi:hypothetical protein
MSDVSEGQKSSSAPTPKTPLYGTRLRKRALRQVPHSNPPRAPSTAKKRARRGGRAGRSGSRCAIRSLLRSSVTGQSRRGPYCTISFIAREVVRVLAPSSGRRARGGKVRLSFRFYYANLIILALNLHTEQSENVASFVAVDRVGSASPHSQRNASSTPAHTHPGGHTNTSSFVLHACDVGRFTRLWRPATARARFLLLASHDSHC